MGSGPSNLYIYLGHKDGTDKIEGEYTVTIKREICKDCTNFEKVSYQIKYDKTNKTGIWNYYAYYSVTLYTGKSYDDIGYYVFCYYYPDNGNILKEVTVYYSIVRPEFPVVVSFITTTDKTYNCRYESLKNAGWDYPSNMGKYFISGSPSDQLDKEFRKLLMTMYFFIRSGYNTDVEQVPKYPDYSYYRHYLNDSKKFHRVGFTSNCNKMHAKLYTDRWFWKKKNSTMTGLDDSADKLFDGVIVYYSDDEPLLIECVNGCKEKTQYVRKDKGTNFCKASVPYKDYTELEGQLEKIKKGFDSGNINEFCSLKPGTSQDSSTVGQKESVGGESSVQTPAPEVKVEKHEPPKAESKPQTLETPTTASSEDGHPSTISGQQSEESEQERDKIDSTPSDDDTNGKVQPPSKETPPSQETSDKHETSGGDGSQTESKIQELKQEDDGTCPSIIALGAIASTIVSGTVIGAATDTLYRCLNLIKLLT